MNQILLLATNEMDLTIVKWKEHLKTIRIGYSNASILDKVMINYYGTLTPLNQIGQITTPDPQLLVIKPWDKSLISKIVSGINKANLNLNPISDAEVIRINIPILTEEIRKELIKKMNKELENFKVHIRNIRRNRINSSKKNKNISKDDIKLFEQNIQIQTNKTIKKLDDLAKEKEKELMSMN